MTMLDRMRRHKGWLKWSLALVILAFIVLYIPALMDQGPTGLGNDVVAAVDGREITANEFRRSYQAQLDAFRGAYGGNVNERMLKQLGIEQQILQQLVDERAALAEAERRGIDVTDAEVAERIVTLPAFQQNGQFIGRDRYRAILAAQRLSVPEFEEGLRRSLVIGKLQAALTGWVSVTDDEVAREFRRRNEKVKLEVAAFPAETFRPQVAVSDADVAAHFEAHKEDYRIGERRKVRYLLLDLETVRKGVRVSSREVERSYNQNLEMYSTPEQVRASHILLKTEGKDEAAVKARAEKVLAEVKAGGDFAELAKKYSEDEQSAKQGGDLDYFSRGSMVPEFDEFAFSAAPGTLSDLVKTQYGFHIIKLVDKKPATTRPLDEVREQIVEQVQWERAQSRAATDAQELEEQINKPADLEKVAAARKLKVEESGFFTRDEPVMALGPSPEATQMIFGLQEGQVTGAVQVSRGYAFLTLAGVEQPRVPKLDEVKDRVREDVVKLEARDLARAKAQTVAAEARASGDFSKAAKAAGVEVKTTELVPRESPIPEIGVSPAVDAVAFSMAQNAISEPIVTDSAVAVVRLVEKTMPTSDELAAARSGLREELLNDKRNRFFSAYMVKAKQDMDISVNRESLQRLLGS